MKSKKTNCPPTEVPIKSFFLGPAAENSRWLDHAIQNIFQSWYSWRKKINSKDGRVISESDQELFEFIKQQNDTQKVIQDLIERFENEIPKFSPRYMGHMFSEISMPALLGHLLTLLHNPNNISPEASRVGTEIELEAIRFLCQIVGYGEGTGHFTSGGTVANFEFLFRARERLAVWLAQGVAMGNGDPIRAAHMGWGEFKKVENNVPRDHFGKYFILNHGRESYLEIKKRTGIRLNEPILFVPASKHYSWPKAMHLLGLGESNIQYLELDRFGRVCPRRLKDKIHQAIVEKRPILGLVAIAGTTELGSIDPIDSFVSILEEFKKNDGLDIWLHVDGAYGGFMGSLSLMNENETQNEHSSGNISDAVRASLIAMASSDSITLDPHKLGYVPYSSGAFICREEKNYFMKSFTGPYLVSERKNIGNYTLEGSRSAAGAVATFASIQSFNSTDGYKKLLRRTIHSKNVFKQELERAKINIFIPDGLDTNILCFVPLKGGKYLSEVNLQTLKIYDKIQKSSEYWISKTTLFTDTFGELINDFSTTHQISLDCERLELLRLTLMNPFTISKESSVDHVAAFCAFLKRELSNAESMTS